MVARLWAAEETGGKRNQAGERLEPGRTAEEEVGRERKRESGMELVQGLLKVRVIRGLNLVKRDILASDPYVLITMGEQKLKTGVVRTNVNPLWNEDLTLCVKEPALPVKLEVLDKDTFDSDDSMGHAEFNIQAFMEVVNMHVEDAPDDTVIKKITPNRDNCLADESKIYITSGRVTQDIMLRLKDVKSGEVELRLQWIDLPSFKDLGYMGS